jgi:gluconate 2-dehydrogenase gamma chain
MAGQGVERREILRILAMAAGATTFPGFQKWAFACGHSGNALTQVKPAHYLPLFFCEQEYALLERLTDIIIPSDATPGAREAGVSEFIDLMVSRDATLQQKFRTGLMWLNAYSSSRRNGKTFLTLAPDQQVVLLEPLAYKKKYRPGLERGRDFFELVREYTVMGFYTTEIGLKELDFPGLRFYSESPACPHKDDPEHRHLPPPIW